MRKYQPEACTCKQPCCKECLDNQGSTEKSDNFSGGKTSGISSTKAIQKPQDWQHNTHQHSPLNGNSPQQPISQHYRKKGSQDSRGATISVTPSCGPSSTNALLSDIIRLDDDEECWLKGQLMMGNNPVKQMIGPILPGPDEVMKLQISNKNQDDVSSCKNSGKQVEDEESSKQDSSPKITKQDFNQYRKLYEYQLFKAKQEKMAQIRKEALENSQPPIQVKNFDPDCTEKLISSSEDESSYDDEESSTPMRRTRKFKCDNSSGLIVTNDIEEKDETINVRVNRRMNNTQKYKSDSDTMFDGNNFQQANTQKNEKTSDSMNSLQEDLMKKSSDQFQYWTGSHDRELLKLMDDFGIEQIKKVCKQLNDFINEEKKEIPEIKHDELCRLKNDEECIDRWLNLRNTTEDSNIKQLKGNWTLEEDKILKKKVDIYGLKKWKEIATFLPGRIGKQCRERWYNNVDPNLNKEKWTVAEDIQLMELHKQYGNKWVQIQKFMPGRIDNDIKNRFNASLRKYKTFDEYLESIDKKRERHQKKYYWRQNYELRSTKKEDSELIQEEAPVEEEPPKVEEKKQPRTRQRDEKCTRKQEERIKRRSRATTRKENEEAKTLRLVSKEKVQTNSQEQQMTTPTKECEIMPHPFDSFDLDDEERILVQNLLQFDMPKNLMSDKLFYRKVFRLTKFSLDEWHRKCKLKPITNAFEIYTHIPPENSGPKVLYITAKSQDGKDKDSDIIKDIEGHAIEKIHTSKLSEKAQQEKWRMEEEELEKVRQAREILRQAKAEGNSQNELVAKAKQLLRNLIRPSEFSAQLIVQSDKSDQTSKTMQIQDKKDSISTISISPVKSVVQKTAEPEKVDHPCGSPNYLTGNSSTYHKIFTTHFTQRDLKELQIITNLVKSIGKNGTLPGTSRNEAYNLRNQNFTQPPKIEKNLRSVQNTQQKIVQINKCGNTASISIIHPGGEKTTCPEKLRNKPAPQPQKKLPEKSNNSQIGNKNNNKTSVQKPASPKRASPKPQPVENKKTRAATGHSQNNVDAKKSAQAPKTVDSVTKSKNQPSSTSRRFSSRSPITPSQRQQPSRSSKIACVEPTDRSSRHRNRSNNADSETVIGSIGQRNSIRIMARKLDQINKEQEDKKKDETSEDEEEEEEEEQEEEQEDEQTESQDEEETEKKSETAEIVPIDKKNLKDQLKRFELLKRIQDQLNQIKTYRSEQKAQPQPAPGGTTNRKGNGVMTRSSLRLRDRNTTNTKKQVLKEKEIRNNETKKFNEKAQRIEKEAEDIRQHNKLYNLFIAKELKIDKPSNSVQQQQQDQPMEVQEERKKAPPPQPQPQPPQQEQEYLHIEKQLQPMEDYQMYPSSQQYHPHPQQYYDHMMPPAYMPMQPPAHHQFHQLMPAPFPPPPMAVRQPYYPPPPPHYSQMQQIQQAQLINDHFKQQQYVQYSQQVYSHHETSSRKVGHEDTLQEQKKEQKPNGEYNRMMMMAMLQQRMNTYPPSQYQQFGNMGHMNSSNLTNMVGNGSNVSSMQQNVPQQSTAPTALMVQNEQTLNSEKE